MSFLRISVSYSHFFVGRVGAQYFRHPAYFPPHADVVTPGADSKHRWAEEVEHWYPFLSPSDIHLIKGNKDKLYLANVSR